MSKTNKEKKIIGRLKEKDVFYLKEDKYIKVVILDKSDYQEKVENLIETGPYEQLTRNPLPKIVSDVKTTLTNCKALVTSQLKGSLPKIYYPPKIHKPGKSV